MQDYCSLPALEFLRFLFSKRQNHNRYQLLMVLRASRWE
jgi:hypothetical protein